MKIIFIIQLALIIFRVLINIIFNNKFVIKNILKLDNLLMYTYLC